MYDEIKFEYFYSVIQFLIKRYSSFFNLVPAFVLLCGFLGPLVLKLPYPESWYDHQRLFELVILTLSACLLPFLGTVRSSRLAAVLIWTVVGGGMVVSMYAQYFRLVLTEVTHLALLVGVAVWWSDLIRKFAPPRALVLGMQIAVGLYIGSRCLQYAAILTIGTLPDPLDFFDGFVNPRFFGAWITLSWPLLLLHYGTYPNPPSNGWKVVPAALLVLAATWWALAIFSGSRATWLAAGVVVLVMAGCGVVGRRLAMRGVLAILLGFVIHQLFFISLPEWLTGQTSLNSLDRLRTGFSLSRRDELWRIAVEGIADSPWFGAGPMMFSATNNGVASTTHNISLQLAYEWGLPFSALVGLLVVRWLWRQFLLCRTGQNPLRMVLWMCIAGALIEAQFDGLLSAPHSQLIFTVLIAWMLSLDRGDEVDVGSFACRLWPALRFAPLVMAIALWWAIWPELSNLELWELETLQRTGAGHFQPRFWLQGVVFPGG